MNVILFGATGMIGHGALRAALADDRVERVLAVGRRPSGARHAKLDELVHDDFFDYTAVEDRLVEYDACLFCLGVSSAGMREADYRRVTHDLTLAAARTLVRLNPHMRFVYVSGAGTDAESRQMWARVKADTETSLSALSFGGVYHARPGFIQPVGGARSRTALYRVFYAATAPLYPLLRRLVPNAFLDSDALGRALVETGLAGAPKSVLKVPDLRELAERADRFAG